MKSKGKYFHFAIQQRDRTYKLRCDTEQLADSWVRACTDIIEKRKNMDGEDSGISDPFNTTHEQVRRLCFWRRLAHADAAQHVDFDMKWAGTKEPSEVFEKGINLGKGAYGSVWEARHRDSGRCLCHFFVVTGFFCSFAYTTAQVSLWR